MPIETDFPSLARELGLTRKQREEIIANGLVTAKTSPGKRAKITDEDAERIRQAVTIAAAAGVAVIIVLRLLASGTVKPALV